MKSSSFMGKARYVNGATSREISDKRAYIHPVLTFVTSFARPLPSSRSCPPQVGARRLRYGELFPRFCRDPPQSRWNSRRERMSGQIVKVVSKSWALTSSVTFQKHLWSAGQHPTLGNDEKKRGVIIAFFALPSLFQRY